MMDLQRKLDAIQAKGQLRQLREVEAVDGKWVIQLRNLKKAIKSLFPL